MRLIAFVPLLALFCTFSEVQAWTGTEAFDPKENYTSHCFGHFHEVGAMKKGETRRIKDLCAIAECSENRDVKLTGCAPIQAAPPCHIADGDISKPFPQCCYEVICDKNKPV